MNWKKKNCPYYKGVCGLDESEETLCFSDAPYCRIYREKEEEHHERNDERYKNCLGKDQAVCL